MEELGGECTSHPLLLTVYRLTGVPNTGGSAIVYTRLEGPQIQLTRCLLTGCTQCTRVRR